MGYHLIYYVIGMYGVRNGIFLLQKVLFTGMKPIFGVDFISVGFVYGDMIVILMSVYALDTPVHLTNQSQ